METDYTKREVDAIVQSLDHKFLDIHTNINETRKLFTEEISKLETQVRSTNGSVGNLKAWRTGLTMCVAIIAFIVIPLILFSFNLSQQNLKLDIINTLRK